RAPPRPSSLGLADTVMGIELQLSVRAHTGSSEAPGGGRGTRDANRHHGGGHLRRGERLRPPGRLPAREPVGRDSPLCPLTGEPGEARLGTTTRRPPVARDAAGRGVTSVALRQESAPPGVAA